MHPQPKIFQAELAKIFSGNGKRIKIVFVKISAKFSASFLVFAPEKASHQKQKRDDDRGDDVDGHLAFERFNHKHIPIWCSLSTFILNKRMSRSFAEIRNPNVAARNRHESITKSNASALLEIFAVRICLGFRYSNFGFLNKATSIM
jgi:hypothetical protein